jgi:hypothetical protein
MFSEKVLIGPRCFEGENAPGCRIHPKLSLWAIEQAALLENSLPEFLVKVPQKRPAHTLDGLLTAIQSREQHTHHLDRRRTKKDNEHAREDEENEREQQFDRQLGRKLFGSKTARGTH